MTKEPLSSQGLLVCTCCKGQIFIEMKSAYWFTCLSKAKKSVFNLFESFKKVLYFVVKFFINYTQIQYIGSSAIDIAEIKAYNKHREDTHKINKMRWFL